MFDPSFLARIYAKFFKNGIKYAFFKPIFLAGSGHLKTAEPFFVSSKGELIVLSLALRASGIIIFPVFCKYKRGNFTNALFIFDILKCCLKFDFFRNHLNN